MKPWLVLVLSLASFCLAQDGDVAEKVVIYADGPSQGYEVAHWAMQCEEKTGDAQVGTYIWVNGDCKAQPWSGVRIFAGAGTKGFTVTDEWLAKGFIRFQMTGGYDRYGNPGPVTIQLRPETKGLRYQFLRSSQVARGRGLDEDPESWQTVLIPLSYWTELKAGAEITGLNLQSRGQIVRPIGYDQLSFVRFREIPEWLREQGNEEVAQPDVSWPALAELPASMRGADAVPRMRAGAFVDGQGRRVFVISPYCREDRRLDVWGTTDATRGKEQKDFGLFDPENHGWIYRDLFTAESIRRLGFNSYSATMPPQPFWEALGYGGKKREQDPARLAATYQRLGVPFYVDTVCWPYTLGAPGTDLAKTPLPPTALTEGRNHWMPYRITGEGRDVWLRLWRMYAQRYRDAGVPVIGFELLNEPAYLGRSADHMAEFATWLEKRYGTVAELNRVWGAELAGWQQAADVSKDDKVRKIAGRFFDYDDYLAEQFTALVRDGVAEVRRILPGAPVGVQTMGGYASSPREAVFKHRFVRYESLVLTPTGGGRWTAGGSASRPPRNRLASPIAPAPLENDLLLALADGKMIFDNETYLRGQTRREVRNRLWEHVISGLDGLTVFSWSKRGWAWWKDRAKVQTEADKYPYSNLNPIARRTDALRGILQFSEEVESLADDILPKHWGPTPTVGLLYSWPQARRRVLDATTPGKTAAYHAALRYDHCNLRLVPSDRAQEPAGLAGLRVLVLGGVRYLEPELVPVVWNFVQQGGTVVYGEAIPEWEIHGQPLAELPGLGALGNADATPAECGEVPLRCGVRTVRPLPRTEILLRDDASRPVLLRRKVGKGWVYLQTADVVGYSLATLLDRVFAELDATPNWHRAADVRPTGQDEPAANVLVSRRSYADRHVLLLQNHDGYAKELRVRLPGLDANWQVTDGLAKKALRPATDGSVVIGLGAGDPAVLIWRRQEAKR
jgi:hypothetical protein